MPPLAKRLCVALTSGLLALGLGLLLASRAAEGEREFQAVDLRENRAAEEAFAERREELASAPEGASIGPGALERGLLPRGPLSAERAEKLFVQLQARKAIFDPQAYFTRPPGVDRKQRFPEHPAGGWRVQTNSLGLRDEELLEEPVDLRILATGDSHADGACAGDENFANRLEARLRARLPGTRLEVVNAAKGGYSFYNYLGILEKLDGLEPDLFVVCVYGGNDFLELLSLVHYFQGTPRPSGGAPYKERIRRAQAVGAQAISQAFQQFAYFATFPEEAELASRAARAATDAIVEHATARGIETLFLYLPPLSDVEASEHAKVVEDVSEALELSPEDLAVTGRLADEWLAHCRARELAVLDLREDFAGAAERLYWQSDHHINLAAHERIAAILESRVLEWWASPEGGASR